MLLGGPNRYFAFSRADVETLIEKLQVASRNDVRLVIVPSRRTPAAVTARVREVFGGEHYVWDGGADNPKMALFGDIVLDLARKAGELARTTRL